MSSLILKATNLCKKFYYPSETTIFKNLTLEVTKGETVAIMGRSGQGKSTLLQILGTLDNPCSGELEISGRRVSFFNKSQIRSQHLAFVFQSFHLLEDYTSIENVLMPAYILREKIDQSSTAYQRAWMLLELVGLSERALHQTKLLSGGEKQRVALARAMMNEPDLILADEPSGNLDRDTAVKIHDILINYAKGQNKSLIVVTHDKQLAALCDTVYDLTEAKLKKPLIANQ